MNRTDQVLAKLDDFVARSEGRRRELARSPEGQRASERLKSRELSPSGLKTRLQRNAVMIGVGLAAFVAVYMIFGAIGIDGFLLMLALGVAGFVGVNMLPAKRAEPEPTTETIRNAELAALPIRVERWLARRRADLPAAASAQIDELLLRLEVLAEQLEKVDQDAPVVKDARKLIGDELPRLVESYLGVHASYRGAGSEAETQLTEGLETVSSELKRLSEQLARGDLDRLAIEGRFLESKYKDG
ncbi:MAG: hypothetical protein V2J26_07000 [Pacificimonas sp.]|jgi:hypothetical protein|nr:hypothetical protein [Pacificimonas sp.]